jgi:hypothetical protein
MQVYRIDHFQGRPRGCFERARRAEVRERCPGIRFEIGGAARYQSLREAVGDGCSASAGALR